MEEQKSIFGQSPPPRKDHVLFRAADAGTNACISYWYDVNYPYKKGFRMAAGRLALQVCESHSDQDSLVYPILYLYRHHIELVLKDIFRTTAMLLDRPIADNEEKALGRHDLLPLWELVVPLLDPACESIGEGAIPADDIEGVNSYLEQVAEHDPDGQRFRYATVRLKSPKNSNQPVNSSIRNIVLSTFRRFLLTK
ncbi:hypothetical protein HGP14_09355 [Rhizobium sp. P32RR-XVIII]|uniref:hypothetical protein n=1 Tax=Rhizobium sp. P32RR-XVIII TaxID=2726738 RepID=UPI001456DBFB|nr:hypothetical protein [Rhizobium sp. P32RR-XVIII]NLS03565.1 hypothetical protein [Rhizobium sp. P32RR-XVIII]